MTERNEKKKEHFEVRVKKNMGEFSINRSMTHTNAYMDVQEYTSYMQTLD